MLVATAATTTAATATAAAATTAAATTEAATATAAATEAATATAAAEATAAAAAARFTRTSFVDSQGAAFKLATVEVLNRRIGGFLSVHLDKSKTARTTRVTICHDIYGFNCAHLGKNFF
mgnify:CR=1 FL=1